MEYYESLQTPIGTITLFGSNSYLQEVHFGKKKIKAMKAPTGSPVAIAKKQLQEYFSGKRTKFNVPLSAQGTEFQKSVWKKLKTIPFGKLNSYGDLAKKLGKPGASRAVGGANNKNPIPLIIPCHRVIGASGDLVGFAPGLACKRWLLKFEGHNLTVNRVITEV
jgi:methylated-DNA-[protein]-cysteine S-methyltransferase